MVFKNEDLLDISQNATFFYNKFNQSWIIDFKSEVKIEILKIYLDNENIWDIPKNIVIEFYLQKGTLIDEKKYKVFGNNLLNIELNSIKTFDRIKIYLEDKSIFFIPKWEAYQRKYKGILVSITDDGLGCRLVNMLVSMYLSNLAGYKFGFVWKRDINPCGTNDLRNNISSYGFNIILPQIENEEYIFGEEFIKKHSYTQMIKRESKHLARDIPFQKLNETLPYSGAFGWSYHDTGIRIMGIDKNYIKELPKLYSYIQFSPHISEIISKAQKETQKIGKFVVLHLRGGDAVYDIYIRSRGNHYKKNMPIEIAFEILSMFLSKSNIVCFSDDIETLEKFLSFSKKHLKSSYKIYNIAEFLPKNLNDIDRLFFEVTFMSMGEEIFSAGSHFSYLASIIKGKKQNLSYQYFSEKQQSEIINKNLEKIKIHPIAQAFSYFHLYMLKRKEQDFKFLNMLMSRAMKLDGNNYLYKIAFIDSLIKLKDFQKANLCLQDILTKDKKGFFEVFFDCILYRNFMDIREDILNHKNKGTELRELACEICKNIGITLPNGAVLKIKNYLSYKLGVAYLQTNLFLRPFVLYGIKKEHFYYRKFQNKMIEQGLLENPQPLEDFADYYEGLKIKESKEFKIGEAIIKADKTSFKLGYLKLPFDIFKINS